jgi:hypothetical protein
MDEVDEEAILSADIQMPLKPMDVESYTSTHLAKFAIASDTNRGQNRNTWMTWVRERF